MIIYLIQISTNANSSIFEVDWNQIIFSFSISVPITLFVFYIDYLFIKSINNSEWFKRHLIPRIVFEFVILILIALVSSLFGNLPFINLNNFSGYLSNMQTDPSAIAAILFNIFAVTIIEFIFQYQQKSRLEEEYNHILYQQLKTQINPHFLFNSLSVIIALMNKDINVATEYTHKLSNVYRYVLTHNDDDTISLSKELDFISNYIEILQIRHGKGLQIIFAIDKTDYMKKIPPMSLQLLIENIVKHNAISEQTSLNIMIQSDQRYISVTNNIIPRMHPEKGLGMGLINLKRKYNLLVSKDIIIEKSAQFFIVKLPLL